METTRNTLKAAMAALSAMAVALVAVILVSVHPVFASAAEEPVQGVAEGNISLSVPATTLPCALTADGTVITPDADKYAFVNTGSVAVSIASPEVKLSNGVHDVNMSAKAAVVATTDKNQFKKLFDESDKQIDWILNNQGQGEQTLMQGQSLCVKFGIDPLTYDKNANVIEQAATSGGCNIASVNYAYKESRMPAYAVFFDNGKTAKLYKGYDRPVKGQPYRGSAEPVFDFVDDIENDKAEVFVPYKDVLERVSVETKDGEIQPTTTKGWFTRCRKLAGVEGLSKLDTSKVTDMSDMFSSCRGLTSLDVSNFNTSKVTDMSWMFIGCSGLTSLDVSNFNTGKVTNMQGMFQVCRGLKSLDVSGFDTGNVTKMSNMFEGCSGLTSLDLSNLDTAKVTSMSHMFEGCSGLTTLDVSKFDTSKVTSMSWMFSRCSGLTSLDLSNFDTSKVTNMSMMFDYCSGLEQVTLRGGWSRPFADCSLPKTMYVKDGNGSFAEYTGGFPTTKTDTYYTENGIKQAFAVVYDDGNGGRAAKLYNRAKVPAAGDTFEGVAVTEVITGIENKPGAFEDKGGGKKLTKVEVVDYGIQPLTTKKWFSGCSKLASVEGLSKLDTSKATDMSGMFSSCGGLTSLDVSKLNTANVTSMADMFRYCSGLSSLDVSKFNTANVTDMKSMFQGCSSLTSLNLLGFKTANVTDMSFMFQGCMGLTSLGLSSFDTANVTDMADMFGYCRGLSSLDVSKFNTANVTNMKSMFQGCSSLTSLNLLGFKTAKVMYMSFMFQECSSLTSLGLSSFDTANVVYMDYMFYECSGLASLGLSNFDTANVVYMGYMFEQCNKLNTVTFPNDAASKTQLKKALSDCGITLRSNQRTIDEDANALSASDNMESHQCEEGVEHRNLQYEGAAPLSGSTAAAAIIAPSSNVSNAGKTEADSPGQSGGSESKEPSGEKADNCQPDSDGNLSSDKSGSSAHMK